MQHMNVAQKMAISFVEKRWVVDIENYIDDLINCSSIYFCDDETNNCFFVFFDGSILRLNKINRQILAK